MSEIAEPRSYPHDATNDRFQEHQTFWLADAMGRS
jgi:hypothetical protein